MLDTVEDVKEKESGAPLGFKESWREDLVARNHNRKKKGMDAKRGGLRNIQERTVGLGVGGTV